MPKLDERFWVKVNKTDACWEWLGATSGSGRGYGRFYTEGRFLQAHRLAYEDQVGPIPEGLFLDHLCRNTHCVRPDHLEPVTHAENVARGYWATRTHCSRGHEYTPETTYFRLGGHGRKCRTCNNEDSARYKARRRAARSAPSEEDA